MIKQKDLIHNTNWDILIIIDACRYDTFKNMYKDVLGDEGVLIKTETPAPWTLGWFIEMFENMPPMKDVIAISSAYFINSLGEWDNVIFDIFKRYKYKNRMIYPNTYFGKIIDVWKTGYDKKLSLIPPEKITEEAIKEIKENPNNRFFVKYFQLHDPYISMIKREDYVSPLFGGVNERNTMIGRFTNLKKILNTFFSDEFLWKIFKRLGILSTFGFANIWDKYGKNAIIKFYEDDMRMMLEDHVKKLIDMFPEKTVVVTTDYGELLGEGGRYGHGFSNSKLVTEIPWFVMNGRKK